MRPSQLALVVFSLVQPVAAAWTVDTANLGTGEITVLTNTDPAANELFIVGDGDGEFDVYAGQQTHLGHFDSPNLFVQGTGEVTTYSLVVEGHFGIDGYGDFRLRSYGDLGAGAHVVIETRSGNDTLEIDSLSALTFVRIETGSGNDQIAIGDLSVVDDVTILTDPDNADSNAEGDDTLQIVGTAYVLGNLDIVTDPGGIYTAGDDHVRLQGRMNVYGHTSVEMGAGADSIDIVADGGDNVFHGNLTLHTGDADGDTPYDDDADVYLGSVSNRRSGTTPRNRVHGNLTVILGFGDDLLRGARVDVGGTGLLHGASSHQDALVWDGLGRNIKVFGFESISTN